jgi:hypothetical protein
MKKGGTGGAQTARAGSNFETDTDESFIRELNKIGYLEIDRHELRGKNGTLHGRTLENSSAEKIEIYYKSGIYRLFFEPRGINYKEFFSARLEPDTAIYSHKTKTLTIIEKKQMSAAGSVAEKLQTCDYKRKYYETLTATLGIKVNIYWVLGKYFEQQQTQLRSVYEYMLSKGSKYYFGDLPINELEI